MLPMPFSLGGLWACGGDSSADEPAAAGRPEFVVKTFDLYETESGLSPMNLIADGRTIRYDGTNGTGLVWPTADRRD